MRTKAIIIFLFIFTGALYSQDRNEPAQQEGEQWKNVINPQKMVHQGVSELDAKKTILGFFYDTKAEVRKFSRGLSSLEWEQMKIIQQEIWDGSVRLSLKDYSTTPYGNNRFLGEQYEMLLKYEDVIIDILYSAMRQDLSEEAFSSILADAVIEVNSVAKRDF